MTQDTARLCYTESLARVYVVSPQSPMSRELPAGWRLKLSQTRSEVSVRCVTCGAQKLSVRERKKKHD